MGSKASKASRQNRLRLVLAGVDKHFQNVSSFTLGGRVITRADFEKLLQEDIDASDASVQAQAKLREDVQVERNSHAQVNPVLRLFKLFVVAQFGDTSDASTTLADFGFTPRKAPKKTLAVKTEATAKTQATRSARHTMGPKQKAKVKGTVPAGGTTPPKAAQGTS
jgi:hypothetical protein